MALYITMFAVWTIIIIIGIIVEMHTMQQIGFAIAIGGLIALIVHAFLPEDVIYLSVEGAVFISLWAISWVVFFLFRKKINKAVHDPDDGFYSYLNRVVVASKGNIDRQYGELRINDKIFRFHSDDKIEENQKIKIIKIKGVTFFVEKIKEATKKENK